MFFILLAAAMLSAVVLAVRALCAWNAPPFGPGAAERVAGLIAISYAALMAVGLAWRTILWLRYRPLTAPAADALPTLSIVMPAFNESSMVADAIRALGLADYPRDKFEIIVIDDGSVDDTWRHIRSAVAALPPDVVVRTIRQPVNLGKRRALYDGFQLASGEILVTIDSDSIVRPDALRHLVAPFPRHPGVHCVAGCVEALNPGQSIITRFLKCYYSLSFKFVRAYQNAFFGIYCAPGAISAYRASAVRPVLDEWLSQRFLGVPCATGEDRALTNLVLRGGGLTAYQQNAVVRSAVPVTYAAMVNMFLRWARSNIRETIVLWSFLWLRFRQPRLAAFRFNMALVLLSLVLSPVLAANAVLLVYANQDLALHYLAGGMAFSLFSAGVYYASERDRDWLWLLGYHAFWLVGISWIVPYALCTLRNTSWLTRTIQPRARSAAADPAVRVLLAVKPSAVHPA